MDVPLKIIFLNLIKSCTAYCLCPGAGAEPVKLLNFKNPGDINNKLYSRWSATREVEWNPSFSFTKND